MQAKRATRRDVLVRAALSGILVALVGGCVEEAKPAENAKSSGGATTTTHREHERTEKGGCGKAGCG